MAITKTAIVARAAKELDKCKPGWAYNVRISKLFASTDRDGNPNYVDCVLVQAFGDPAAWGNHSWLIERAISVGDDGSPFWVEFTDGDADRLRELWAVQVRKRRGNSGTRGRRTTSR